MPKITPFSGSHIIYHDTIPFFFYNCWHCIFQKQYFFAEMIPKTSLKTQSTEFRALSKNYFEWGGDHQPYRETNPRCIQNYRKHIPNIANIYELHLNRVVGTQNHVYHSSSIMGAQVLSLSAYAQISSVDLRDPSKGLQRSTQCLEDLYIHPFNCGFFLYFLYPSPLGQSNNPGVGKIQTFSDRAPCIYGYQFDSYHLS